MSRICLCLALVAGCNTAGVLSAGGLGEPPGWLLGDGHEATAVVVNQGARPAWVKIHLIPRGRAGVISPPLRLQPGQEMAFNLRYFLAELEHSETLSGFLKVRFGGPVDRIEARVINEEVYEGGLQQTSAQLAEFSEDPFDPCEDPDVCNEDDPLYILYDRFEYREWDVDGDGITDPDQRSSLVIYDSNGSITWADSLYAPLAPLALNPPKHDMLCASQIRGSCVTERCSIVEYVDTPESGRVIIGGDFLEITTCPNQEPLVEVFGEPVTLNAPELFYAGCVQSASLHFNAEMDAEVAAAKSDMLAELNDVRKLAVVASGVTIGGLIKEPTKMGGRILRSTPLGYLLWAELRAISRGHDAQHFLRDNSCAWVTAERLCYEKTEEAFGPVGFQRFDIYAILEAKNINTDVVRRHCRQP